jgi:hypothetical protein
MRMALGWQGLLLALAADSQIITLNLLVCG